MLQGDLINEMEQLSTELDQALSEQEQRGRNLADCEAAYQVILRQKALIEKDSGTPVTFISQFIRGDREIAEKRRERDIAEALYQTAKDRVVGIRLKLKIVDAQAGREWSAIGDSDYPAPPDFTQ